MWHNFGKSLLRNYVCPEVKCVWFIFVLFQQQSKSSKLCIIYSFGHEFDVWFEFFYYDVTQRK